MSDISEFETRITAALERVGRAVALAEEQAAGAQSGGIDTAEMESEIGRLREELEAEKEANAQMEARVKAIHEKQTSHVASLEGEVEGLRRHIYDLETGMGELRHANDTLRANNEALRNANAQGVGDPTLINAGLQAELAAASATRTAQKAELEALLGDLKAALPPQTAQAEEV